jgi:hypothetical protein
MSWLLCNPHLCCIGVRYKQRGPYLPNVPKENASAAVGSCNVFFHLMYEDAVDFAALREKDPMLMHRVTALIDNYGQVCPRLPLLLCV